jgi:hypothetical protein
MVKSDSKGKGKRPSLHSHPPPGEPMDVAWDEDTVPRFDYEEAGFERVTAIPELPPEVLAKQLMAAHAAEEAGPGTERSATENDAPEAPPHAASLGSPIPFELEGAVFSPEKPAFESSEPGPNSTATTTPPPGTRSPTFDLPKNERPGELVLEIDERALESTATAPNRWQRPEKTESISDRALELDLGSLGRDLAPGESVPPVSDPSVREIADRYATGDFSGALVLAEALLESQPEHPEAQRYVKNCRDVLMQMYAARLGPLDHLVTMSIPTDQIRWLSLDHRAGFLLSLVDGTCSVEEVLDISGMPRLDALRILYSLLEERVISLAPRSG